MIIENLNIAKILQTALKNGGEFAELFEEHSIATHLVFEGKSFEKIAQGQDSGVGLRVLYDGKTAYAATTEITQSSLMDLAELIAASIRARHFEQDICKFGDPKKAVVHLEIDPNEVPLEKKTALVAAADKVAWSESNKIKQVTTVYRDNLRDITIANSKGEFCRERQTYLIFVSQVVAANGDLVQTGYEPMGGNLGLELFEDGQTLKNAKIAAQRALQMLDAPQAPSGPMPVILASEAGGTMVHEAVGHGLEADLACEGLSVYQDKIGQTVASSLITVIDDPTIPGKRGSFYFDDEGTLARRNVLIEQGKLNSYMYNRQYALRDGVESTGNGRRESYRYRPICRMTNTMIAPGTTDPATILQSVPEGLLVKRMGSGQVNTVNGDFVFEVSEGYVIKNGQIDHPIRGATLTGNGPEVLNTIDQVGSDLGYGLGTCGKEGQGVPVADAQPTLRIPEITVGGI